MNLGYQRAVINYDDRLTNCYREGGAQVARCLCYKMHLSFAGPINCRYNQLFTRPCQRGRAASCRHTTRASYLANHFHGTRTLEIFFTSSANVRLQRHEVHPLAKPCVFAIFYLNPVRYDIIAISRFLFSHYSGLLQISP